MRDLAAHVSIPFWFSNFYLAREINYRLLIINYYCIINEVRTELFIETDFVNASLVFTNTILIHIEILIVTQGIEVSNYREILFKLFIAS